MAIRRTLLASLLLAAAALSGCDMGKFFSFGMTSSWEVPNDPATDLAPQVRIGEVAPQPAEGRTLVAPAPAGGRVAYIRPTPGAADRDPQHIFIDWNGRCWQVFGLPHAGKPLENLSWDSEFVLAVDRWYSATQGVRVWIDMRQGKGSFAQAISREAK